MIVHFYFVTFVHFYIDIYMPNLGEVEKCINYYMLWVIYDIIKTITLTKGEFDETI